MPTKVFKTQEDAVDSVELVGVGLLGAGGRGGVSLDRAAIFMPELQERGDDGDVATDSDGNPVPLKGAALTDAAESFAQARGLRIVSIANEKAEPDALRAELGLAAGERPPAQKVAEQDFKETFGDDAKASTGPTGVVIENADSPVDVPDDPSVTPTPDPTPDPSTEERT